MNKMPKPNPDAPGRQVDTGYPQTGIDKGVTRMKIRGTGAATKGLMFASERAEPEPEFGRTTRVPRFTLWKGKP